MKGQHRITQRTLRMEHGLEGPAHDPYGRTSYTLRETRNGRTLKVTLVCGIGTRLFVNGRPYHRNAHIAFNDRDNHKLWQFAQLTGLTIAQFERCMERIKAAHLRPHRAHGGTRWQEGFPGETLLLCRCGQIVDSQFDERAII